MGSLSTTVSMRRKIVLLGVFLDLFSITQTTAFLASHHQQRQRTTGTGEQTHINTRCPANKQVADFSAPVLKASPSSKSGPESVASSSERSSPPPLSPPKKKASTESSGKLQQKKKDKPLDTELQWLKWLYRRWNNVPPGQLDAQTLKHMVPAISIYAKRRSLPAACSAHALLQRYIQEYQAGNAQAVLTTTIFNAAMDAYAKIGQPVRVQEILKQMKELANNSTASAPRLSYLRPDVISLTTLATAWTKSRNPHAATKAQAVLEYMEQQPLDMQPTTVIYNVVLNALAHSSLLDKAQRAEKLVARMQDRCALVKFNGNEDDDLQLLHACCEPSIYTYQSLISCYSRSSQSPERAEQVLNFLKRQAADHGRLDLEPNTHCYSAAIHAWAYSMQPNKARRAFDLLQDIRQRHERTGQKSVCQPNVVVYTAALNACAKPCLPEEREMAFDIAVLIMEELKDAPAKYGTANFLTYAAFLRVAATTLPDSTGSCPAERRDAVVQECFKQCCLNGHVGQIVLDKLADAASPSLYRQLLEGVADISFSSLPADWTRNVKGERRGVKVVPPESPASTTQ
jgi:hypothetical protein